GCNSEVCEHRLPHEEGEFNEDGGCKWAKDPHCVPAIKAEIESVLRSWFGELLAGDKEIERLISGAGTDLLYLYKKDVGKAVFGLLEAITKEVPGA
nr:hypothetical protein [Candidatus Omnitrophota bacterium]